MRALSTLVAALAVATLGMATPARADANAQGSSQVAKFVLVKVSDESGIGTDGRSVTPETCKYSTDNWRKVTFYVEGQSLLQQYIFRFYQSAFWCWGSGGTIHRNIVSRNWPTFSLLGSTWDYDGIVYNGDTTCAGTTFCIRYRQGKFHTTIGPITQTHRPWIKMLLHGNGSETTYWGLG